MLVDTIGSRSKEIQDLANRIFKRRIEDVSKKNNEQTYFSGKIRSPKKEERKMIRIFNWSSLSSDLLGRAETGERVPHTTPHQEDLLWKPPGQSQRAAKARRGPGQKRGIISLDRIIATAPKRMKFL